MNVIGTQAENSRDQFKRTRLRRTIEVSQKDDPAAYMRAYRALNSDYADANRQRHRAYNAALRDLRRRHRDEFETLYQEHIEAAT